MTEIKIAVPAQIVLKDNYCGEHAYPILKVNHDYIRSLEDAGASCYIIAESSDYEKLEEKLSHMDAVLFTGGNDVQPHYYDEEPTNCAETSPGRDCFEFKLMELAKARKMPIFGVCRGLQLMNIFFGGNVYQDIYKDGPAKLKHDQPNSIRLGWHSVEILEGSHLHRALGANSARVNSLHHQAINKVAPGFTVSAKSPDGIIEAIEADGEQFCLAVQWHPEILSLNNTQAAALFRYFVEKVKELKVAKA